MVAARDVGLADLLAQQKVTNRLLAAQLKAVMKQNDLIVLLGSTGLSYQDVADVVGTTAATVSNALTRMRRSKKSRKAA